MKNRVPNNVIAIAVGHQSLISDGEIGADLTRLSWFQRMRAALRLGGGLGERANRISFWRNFFSLACSLVHNSQVAFLA